jgi:hypothetical protein
MVHYTSPENTKNIQQPTLWKQPEGWVFRGSTVLMMNDNPGGGAGSQVSPGATLVKV